MEQQRINAIRNQSRTARGQNIPKTCKAGCLVPESVNYLSMWWVRTHSNLIKRHDRVHDIAPKRLEVEGFHVIKERTFITLTPGTIGTNGR